MITNVYDMLYANTKHCLTYSFHLRTAAILDSTCSNVSALDLQGARNITMFDKISPVTRFTYEI